MTPQPPKHDRCVLTRHDVQSIKDLVFIVGGNSESSAQKAIFEILANNMRTSRLAPSPQKGTSKLCFGSISLSLDVCKECNEIEMCKQKQSVIDFQKQEVAKEAAAQAREDMMKLICEQCPVRNEEMPLEDYSAESCEGCLTHKVYESLRTGGERR